MTVSHYFETMNDTFLLLKYLAVIILSTFKYILGVLALLASPQSNPLIDFCITSFGGILGVFIWIFLGSLIQKTFIRYSVILRQKRNPTGSINPKKFSKKNRILVKIKRFGGVPILALLSPYLLSLPIGCFICIAMESNRWRGFAYMVLSILFWGSITFGSKWIFAS